MVDRPLPAARDSERLNWLAENFVQRVPGAVFAAVVSSDGVPIASSRMLSDDTCDQLAAVTSGLTSLSSTAAHTFGSREGRRTIVEMEHAFYLVMAMRDGSILAALADRDCDVGAVGFEMTRLAKQAGEILTPAPRTGTDPVDQPAG